MIHIVCTTCGTTLRVTGEHDEMEYLVGSKCEWYPENYPCPNCPHKMTLTYLVESSSLLRLSIHDLTAQEAFQALMGMGLPTEKNCKADVLKPALLGQTIVSLDIKTVPNTNRSLIYSITLGNGDKVFLGSGRDGAVVYRLSSPRSITKEVLDGE